MTFTVVGHQIHWPSEYHLASAELAQIIVVLVINLAILGIIPKTSLDFVQEFNRNYLQNLRGNRPRVLPLVGLFCRKVVAICFVGPHRFPTTKYCISNHVSSIILAQWVPQDYQQF